MLNYSSNQSTLKHGRRTFLWENWYAAGNSGQERLWVSFAVTARAFSSNSLVNNMDMTAAIQYILTAAQSLGSQVYYRKSRLTILGLAGVLFCKNEQA